MKVTAVIPSLASHETRPYLRLCVESLRATTDWDIIVVTNGTKTPEPLNIDGITVRLHTSDQGQCIATNIGAQAASPTTDYLMICNDDMYFAPGWNSDLRFEHLVFSPNLVEPTNNNGSAAPFLKAEGGFTIEEFDRELVDFAVTGARENREEPGFNLPFFIRKDVWQTIGGYDTAYDPWGSNSDTDLQTKINLAGIVPMRLRDVLVYHFSNKSGTFDGSHQDFYQNNWDYFDNKWGFNRDQLGSDVWYNEKMLPSPEQIKYSPPWVGKYA